MQIILKNNYNLKEKEVNRIVTRVKVLLKNSYNELLLGYSHNDYQFPGGHVEEGEELLNALNREIKEEVGITLNIKNISPFAEYISYYKDYPNKNINTKLEIYYFEIITDEKPNLKNANYTKEELEGHFKLEYINLDDIENVLTANANKYGDPKGIASEMLEVLKIYKNIDNK